MASKGNYQDLLFSALTLNGDGSTISQNVNGAVTPQRFWYQPPANRKAHIHRMMVTLRDGQAVTAEKYGAQDELANGIEVKVSKDATTLDELTFPGENVKTNAGWAAYCYDSKPLDFGNGDNYVQVRWTFSRSGQPITLDGSNGERLEMTINDDLTGLVNQVSVIQGTLRGIGTADFRPQFYNWLGKLFGVFGI